MLILGVSAPRVRHHRQHPVRRDDDARSSANSPRACPIPPIAALWWALALGADFGGNLTAVGASANVVMLGIARRAGYPDLVLGVHPQRARW